MTTENKLEGTLLGAAGAALWWWNQDSQDRDDRLRNVQIDNRALSQRLNALTGSADWIRLTSPAVRDAGVGIAAATPTTGAPQTVPSIIATASRPDLTGGSNIASLQWPPIVGTYDASGRTAQPGELALATYALTYQEPRAWTQGLTQAKAPTGEQLQQIFWSAQGFSQATTSMKLTQGQWADRWKSLLSGSSGTGSSTSGTGSGVYDVHQDPIKSPTANIVSAQKIEPLSASSAGPSPPPYNNPQTDAAQRWRIQGAAVGGNTAGQVLAHVTFKTEYIMQGPSGAQSFQPVVTTSRPSFVFADNITSSGFDLIAGTTIGASTYVDVFVSVTPGINPGQVLGSAGGS